MAMSPASRQRQAAASLPLADEAALWDAARGGALPARERLIEAYLPFARILAAKVFARRIDHDLEFDEYLQFATVGLIEAVDRYKSERAIQFKTFAAHRINGAILSGIEHLSEKREQICVRQRLLAERAASNKTALDDDAGDIFQQLADVAIGFALGYILEDAGEHDDAIVTENRYSAPEMRQLRSRIHALVGRLPQRERMVIKYHYLNQVPFGAIAESMEISKGRVSQLHRHALDLLRDMMKSVETCDVAW